MIYRLLFAVATLIVGMALNQAIFAVTPAAKRVVHTILIEGVKFTPESLTVNRGDVVVWVNKDPFPHTATAQAGAFDSGSIPVGKSWKFTTTRSGTFFYLCTLHTTMTGVLVVN